MIVWSWGMSKEEHKTLKIFNEKWLIFFLSHSLTGSSDLDSLPENFFMLITRKKKKKASILLNSKARG